MTALFTDMALCKIDGHLVWPRRHRELCQEPKALLLSGEYRTLLSGPTETQELGLTENISFYTLFLVYLQFGMFVFIHIAIDS